MIRTIEAERDAIASAKSKSRHTSAKKIQHLVKLKSIGPEFATVLVGEVFYRTFDNRKQIGSYVGLTPSPFQSGSTSRDQGISRAGNAKARTTMIELAWLWLRNQPDSSLSVWLRERVERRTMKKVYFRLLPFCFLLYVIAYLDRFNIGFATLTMNKDLGLSSYIYGLGAGAFSGVTSYSKFRPT
jgi:transposase